jgi:S1-C subfamily serine protease
MSHVVENAHVARPLPGHDMQTLPYRFGTSQGSGFFISGDGFAVTNNHVVNGSVMWGAARIIETPG